jgi:hypothetical protein
MSGQKTHFEWVITQDCQHRRWDIKMQRVHLKWRYNGTRFKEIRMIADLCTEQNGIAPEIASCAYLSQLHENINDTKIVTTCQTVSGSIE